MVMFVRLEFVLHHNKIILDNYFYVSLLTALISFCLVTILEFILVGDDNTKRHFSVLQSNTFFGIATTLSV